MQKHKSEIKNDFDKRIRKFTLELIHFINSLPNNDRTCNTIANQLIRSGTSVGANLFEARAASSKRDFVNFFNHALKSGNESKFWLELLIDSQRGDHQILQILLAELTEITNILAASILTMKGKSQFSIFGLCLWFLIFNF